MNDIHIGNKLIADFMGAKEDVYPESMPKWVNIFGTNEDNIKNCHHNVEDIKLSMRDALSEYDSTKVKPVDPNEYYITKQK